MELRQNFGMLIWILPFYTSLLAIYIYPPFAGYGIVVGLSITIGGLFVQVKVNEWEAAKFKLIRLEVDHKPKFKGKSSSGYKPWPTTTQLWIRGEPPEFTDSFGWTTAYIWALNGGYSHPSYNNRMKISLCIFRYRGKWSDLIKFYPGTGVFRGSVVNIPEVSRIWGTEIIANSFPELTGKSKKELLNLTPAAYIDSEGVLRWAPKFIIKRAEGSIDVESEQDNRIAQELIAI